MMPLDVAAVLAALPFLPPGKGALILILGGLAVLPVSLLLSSTASGTKWISNLAGNAVRLGLGPCRIGALDEHHCVVSLSACRSCRLPGARSGPCEAERRNLQLAVKSRAPQATVVEVTCRTSGRGDCTFEIRREGST